MIDILEGERGAGRALGRVVRVSVPSFSMSVWRAEDGGDRAAHSTWAFLQWGGSGREREDERLAAILG